MATRRIFIPAVAFTPEATSGNVIPKSSSIDDANDRFPVEILAFADSGTRIGAFTRFGVPKDYSASPKIIVVWKSTATTGAVVWDVTTKAIAVGESLDPSTDDDSQTVTTTTSGTARFRNDSSITLTGTYAADDEVQLAVYRDGVDAADTMAAEALFEGVFFEYDGA